MSRPISILLYGDCPELDLIDLDLEITSLHKGSTRDSVVQEIRGFDLAIIVATGDDSQALQIIRYLRQVAPACASIMLADIDALELIPTAIDAGLHDYVIRAGEPSLIAPLLGHSISRAMQHDHIKKRFHESEKRFWTFFDSSPTGLVIVGLSHKIEHANGAFQDLVGYSVHDLRARTIEDLLHRKEIPIWSPLLQELAQGERDVVRLEQKFIHADNLPRWATSAYVVMRDPDGSPAYFLGMVADRTAEKRIQQNLQHADKMQAMGRLAGGVAHDFNNLLTIINSHCFIIKDSPNDQERLGWSLERILTATRRGSKLTKQLLTFGRRQHRKAEELDPNELLQDLRVILESLFGKIVRVDLALGSELRPIFADRSQMEQLILNLAINARDAMPDGGQFTVRTYNLDVRTPSSAVPADLPAGQYTVIEVNDTGFGMSPEVQQNIFEPFFTTKEIGAGTGLGLATVYGVVRQCEGFITVDSEEGRGTTFHIYLPSSKQDSLTPPKLRRARQRTPMVGTETILLVEDEAELRAPMAKLLQSKGYQVFEAANAEEALAISREYSGTIDLLLTDVIMPGIDGISLAETLTGDRPDTTVLLMSGYTADALSINQNTARQHKLLQKPFGMDILSRTIRQMLKA